jgi:rhodanese-related sulfurtransferase
MTLPIETFATTRHEGTTLDVREADELAICRLEPCVHIPLHELPARWQELRDAPGPIHCLCHHGLRSAQAAGFLRRQGLEALNVSGGIDAWSRAIDPSLPRY